MGFFGKLFEKKECAFCGGEIGLLGNRKLEDGNMCKTCAKKLSVWFDDRRHSTVEQIGKQLAYREENRAKVASFRTTRSFGEYKKLLLDEDAGTFMITLSDTADEMAEENPDVIAISDITSCTLDIDESHRELMQRDKEGKSIPYVPARYEYTYNFEINIGVNNPYFNDMSFHLNRSSIEIVTQQPQLAKKLGMIGKVLSSIEPETSVEYRHYKTMGEELCDTLLKLRDGVREKKAAEAEPPKKVVCPYCNATTTPDASGCCEFCGGTI
ncbi:MAG: DUF4428 domain-containing protein [Ruminococcaceae bacterium]|nr:DUF4428 domain-containing protein [Oscillospiraceae bacterium]